LTFLIYSPLRCNPLRERDQQNGSAYSTLKNRITLIIAHRLSTIMPANHLYVLEIGQVVEVGNHDDLVDQKGLYYAMWCQQSGERRLQEELNAFTESEV